MYTFQMLMLWYQNINLKMKLHLKLIVEISSVKEWKKEQAIQPPNKIKQGQQKCQSNYLEKMSEVPFP